MATQAEWAGSATDDGGGDAVWTNPNNALGPNDTVVATSSSTGLGTGSTDLLMLQAYGFAIPPTATILGFQVVIWGFASIAANSHWFVTLLNGAGSTVGTLKQGTPPTSDGAVTLGGTADMWSTTLGPSDVNSGLFGIRISGSNLIANPATWDLDAVQIVVTYSVPPANTTPPQTTLIGDRLQVGREVTCDGGVWSDFPASVLTFQWQRDNSGGGSFSNISGATADQYTLQPSDAGCQVRCVVTDQGSVSADSNALGLVSAGSDAAWKLNDSAPVDLAQQFRPSATAKAWKLNDFAPLPLAQQFDATPSPSAQPVDAGALYYQHWPTTTPVPIAAASAGSTAVTCVFTKVAAAVPKGQVLDVFSDLLAPEHLSAYRPADWAFADVTNLGLTSNEEAYTVVGQAAAGSNAVVSIPGNRVSDYWKLEPLEADQDVYADVVNPGGAFSTSEDISLLSRYTPGGGGAGNALQVVPFDSATGNSAWRFRSSLGLSVTTPEIPEVVAGDSILFRTVGYTLQAFLRRSGATKYVLVFQYLGSAADVVAGTGYVGFVTRTANVEVSPTITNFGAGPVAILAAVSSGGTTVSSSLTVTRAIPSAASHGSTAVSAAVVRRRARSAAASGSTAVTCAFSVRRPVGPAASHGSTAVSASVVRLRARSASSAGSTAVACSLVRRRALAPSSTGSTAVACSLVRRRALSPASSGSTTATCQLVRRRARPASSTGTTTVSCAVVRMRALAASSNGSTTVSCALVRRRTVTAASTGSTTVTCSLVRTRALTASATGTTTVSCVLVRARARTASSTGTTTATCSLVRLRSLEASSLGLTAVSATVSVKGHLVPVSTGTTAAAAAVVRLRGLSATSTGTTRADALLGRIRPLAALALGTTTAAATLTPVPPGPGGASGGAGMTDRQAAELERYLSNRVVVNRSRQIEEEWARKVGIEQDDDEDDAALLRLLGLL